MVAEYFQQLWANTDWAEAVGLTGQLAFSGRFLVQWIASERKGKSVIPDAFWYLSLVGSTILLMYGILLQRPVLILAYVFNGFIYVRNLVLIHRERRVPAEAPANEGEAGA